MNTSLFVEMHDHNNSGLGLSILRLSIWGAHLRSFCIKCPRKLHTWYFLVPQFIKKHTTCVKGIFSLKRYCPNLYHGATFGLYWLVGSWPYWINSGKWVLLKLHRFPTSESSTVLSPDLGAQEGPWVRCSCWAGTLTMLGGSTVCQVKLHQQEHFLNHF